MQRRDDASGFPLTVPSKRFDVWSRLYSRYTLEPFPAGLGPDVSKTIVPVTQADELLRSPELATATLDLQAAAGTYTVGFTVPDGRRWTVRHLFRGSSTAATRMRLSRGATPMPINVAGTGEAVVHGVFVLDQGWTLGMDTSGDVGDATINMQIHYEEEDAF